MKQALATMLMMGTEQDIINCDMMYRASFRVDHVITFGQLDSDEQYNIIRQAKMDIANEQGHIEPEYTGDNESEMERFECIIDDIMVTIDDNEPVTQTCNYKGESDVEWKLLSSINHLPVFKSKDNSRQLFNA